MMSFRNPLKGGIDASTAWLLSEIAEAKGKATLAGERPASTFKKLQTKAIVQSVESSNRIEGVEVAPERLEPLVLGKAKPRDRSEMEIHGYRQAISLIHADPEALRIEPGFTQQLHRMIQADRGDAGQWKRRDNEIVEVRPGAAPILRFRPVSAKETPRAMEELCLSYHHAVEQTKQPALLLDALFILDFLCIHPFRDANGRVSRLLTLLALYQNGHQVGKYISLERLVEESRDNYYDVLHQSSQGWQEGKHDWLPWVNFYLGIVHRAYKLLEERTGKSRPKPRSKKG